MLWYSRHGNYPTTVENVIKKISNDGIRKISDLLDMFVIVDRPCVLGDECDDGVLGVYSA
jgi:hypothetical protein